MTQAEAIDAVAARCPLSVYPALSFAEVSVILAGHLRYSTRANSTTYTVRQTVVLASANYNARLYECIEAGTSATSASLVAWPLYRDGGIGQVLEDGTVYWRDIGPAPTDNYDISGAVKAAWTLKASKASADIDTSDRDSSTKASQVMAQCLAMAARAEGMWIE